MRKHMIHRLQLESSLEFHPAFQERKTDNKRSRKLKSSGKLQELISFSSERH